MSFILWEFEDREFIFALVDMLLGTRMHNQFDSSIIYTFSRYMLVILYNVISCKWDMLIDLVLIKHNVARILNVIVTEIGYAIGLNYSGVLLWANGICFDVRVECFVFIRCVLSILLGGVSACSLIRLLLREAVFHFANCFAVCFQRY